MIDGSDRKQAVKLILEANAAGARISMACRELNITDRTFQRWNAGDGEVNIDQRPLAERPQPKNKLSDEERREALQLVTSEEYVDQSPAKIVPTLADLGRFLCSESTLYRLLRELEMNRHRGPKKEPVKREPTTHTATGPNQVWTWDITWLRGPINGMYFKLYLFLDLFSRKIVGWEVWETENAELAEELVKRLVIAEKIKGKPLVVHSDNGAPMKAESLHTLFEKLNIQKSFSRPRVSNDNAYSESLFSTLKFRPDYPKRGFETIESARKWVNKFVDWYNGVHKHSAIKFVTPNECHSGAHIKILKNRQETYKAARAKNPERWSRKSRDWSPIKAVSLNPVKKEELESQIKKQEVAT